MGGLISRYRWLLAAGVIALITGYCAWLVVTDADWRERQRYCSMPKETWNMATGRLAIIAAEAANEIVRRLFLI
jgi:hypothetical protein